jgi:hypothetical protein
MGLHDVCAFSAKQCPLQHDCSDYTRHNEHHGRVVRILLRIREVLDSNLGAETGNPDRIVCGFPQSLQVNSGKIP